MSAQALGDTPTLQAIYEFFDWSWPALFTLTYVSLAIVASGHALLHKRDVRGTIAWVGLFWLSPIVGPILYLMFGINRIKRRASRLRTYDRVTDGLYPRTADELRAAPPVNNLSATPAPTESLSPASGGFPGDSAPYGLQALRRFVGKITQRSLTGGNEVTVLVHGDEGYPAMLAAIDGAVRSIALCTYIFDHDRAGVRFVEALTSAMKRGVEVRVLIDGVGARYSRPRITRLLQKNGVPVAKFLKSMFPLRNPYINLRNHRKILVVDGHIGFAGGLNIREGCVLALETDHPVQDLHFRFEGPVVQHLMEGFALDWEFTTEETLDGDIWFPELTGSGEVEARGVPDGPDENFEAIRWSFLGALAAAERSVRITTPYFIPDQTLIAALNLAALRGVSVQIVLPEIGNLRFAQWASTAQLWQVLTHGCDIFLSAPPFDHSKLMLVDDVWAFVGSANWDARSLRLNFEYNIECYDEALAARIGRIIDAKIEGGRRLNLDEVNSRRLPIKLRDGIARLLAPYL